MPKTRRIAGGPLLALCCLGAAWLIAAVILIAGGFNIETLLDGVLNVLTKIGVSFFILTILIRPLHQLLHTKWTAWLLANRRYVGLSFAAWHLQHWWIIGATAAIMGWTEFWNDFGDFVVPASIVLSVITLLAITSTDRAVRFLGQPLWKAIHTVGIYVIWSWFMHVYFSRLPNQPVYVYIYMGLLIGALPFRWIMTARARWMQRSQRVRLAAVDDDTSTADPARAG
jgi:sulfoxide reductase heme-binding subunit YedZ